MKNWNAIPPAFYEKGLMNFGPLIIWNYMWVWTNSNGLFRETISAFRGCCALKFVHALETDQGLLAHTPTGMPPNPEKNFYRENIKFSLKFSMRVPVTSELVGVSLLYYPGDVLRGGGDNMGITFERLTRPTIWKGKNVQNSAQFLTTFNFDRGYLRNGSTYRKSEKKLHQLQPLPSWVKFFWWTLVHSS